MQMNGTLINYFFHCKRQCYLFGNRLNLEDNSEIVKIGKALHEERADGDNTELKIENVRLDKLTKEYLIELKKVGCRCRGGEMASSFLSEDIKR